MRVFNEKGVAHTLFLIAVIGIVAFLAIASSADFKNRLFGQLFQKPQSRAASDPISSPITSTPTPTHTPTPTPQAASKRVFVTKTTYNGNLGGLLGADQKCMAAAQSVNLGGTFKAWLSSSTISASSRLAHAAVPYKLLNGTIVANDWTDLIDGNLSGAINIDESNVQLTGIKLVWTNTKSDGNISSLDGKFSMSCNNWTVRDIRTARVGNTNAINNAWTNYPTRSYCDGNGRLYCFEQ